MTAFALKSDRRSFGRRKVALDAMIEIPLRPLQPCHVLDFSSVGAMLAVHSSFYVPSRFRLVMEKRTYECTVRHREGAIVGVSFAFG